MKISHMAGCALILALFALTASGAAEPAADAKSEDQPAQMLVRLTDFKGVTTIKVVSPQEYSEIRHDIENDNTALRTSYNALQTHWRESHPKMRRQTITHKGRRRVINVRVPVPPFPLKCPPPKEVHMVGQFKDPAALDAKLKSMEAKEEARQARAEKDANGSSFGLKGPQMRNPSTKDATLEKQRAELLEELLKDVETSHGSKAKGSGGAPAVKLIGQ